MWELACLRKRWFSRRFSDWHSAFAGKPAPTGDLCQAHNRCGSCRAPARLRRRRYCWHLCCLNCRHRGLAKARALPRGNCHCQSGKAGKSFICHAAIHALPTANHGPQTFSDCSRSSAIHRPTCSILPARCPTWMRHNGYWITGFNSGPPTVTAGGRLPAKRAPSTSSGLAALRHLTT